MADGYEIDLDRAPQVLANLEEALRQLLRMRNRITNLSLHSLRGEDPVSTYATQEIQRLAMSKSEGSLGLALDDYERELRGQIDGLMSTLSEYQTQEELNSLVADRFEVPEKPIGPGGDNYAI